jgi:hypothetical protein
MRIRVEFKEPVSGDKMSMEMEGPDMDAEELRLTVLDALENALDMELPDDFNLKITEIAYGTIH